MNKRTLLILVVLTLSLSLVAACVPAPSQPNMPVPIGSQPPLEVATPAEAAPAPTALALPTEAPTAEAPATPTLDARPTVPAPAADGSRPLAQLSPQERNDRFSGPAATWIVPNTIYLATIVTDKGNIVAELYQDTPAGANNFATLAQDGFYDGLTFHRVEPGFVIQGGDPAGDGSGGPGYTVPAEIVHPHVKGALAWARTGDEINPERRSSGSQFYITLDVTPFLDGAYSVFGNVVEGMDVAEQIAVGYKIQRIDISQGTTSRLPTPVPAPTPYAPTSQEGRPLAGLSLEQREGLYNQPPATTIDPTKTYQATIETDKGKIVIDLDAVIAPLTVNNFVLLASLGYYDGMPVAHVQADAYLVAGSPNKQPDSDVGYALDLEPTANASAIVTGTLSMYPVPDATTSGVKASGSQFFVSFIAMPETTTPLNVFGKVVEGMDVVLKLAIDDVIKSITITEK